MTCADFAISRPCASHALPYFEMRTRGAAFVNPNPYRESWWGDEGTPSRYETQSRRWQPIFCMITEHQAKGSPRDFIVFGGRHSVDAALTQLLGPKA